MEVAIDLFIKSKCIKQLSLLSVKSAIMSEIGGRKIVFVLRKGPLILHSGKPLLSGESMWQPAEVRHSIFILFLPITIGNRGDKRHAACKIFWSRGRL